MINAPTSYAAAIYQGERNIEEVRIGNNKVWPTMGEPSIFQLTLTSKLDIDIYYTQTAPSSVLVNWGDGSEPGYTPALNAHLHHRYYEPGDYELQLTSRKGCTWSPGAVDQNDSTINYGFLGSYGSTKDGTTPELTGFALSKEARLDVPYAFYGCTGLTSASVPAFISSTSDYIFEACSGLTEISLPDSMQTIAWGLLFDCSALVEITLPCNLSSISGHAFRGTGIRTIDIPSTVTSIGENAFAYCTDLEAFYFPPLVTAIANDVLRNCTSLSVVTIPEGVVSIGSQAFFLCSSLSSLSLPASLTNIYGDNNTDGNMICFQRSGITNFHVAEENPAFCDVDGVLYTKDRSTLLVYPPARQGAYTVPRKVTVHYHAFYYCVGLTKITLSTGVVLAGAGDGHTFGASAFQFCTALIEADLGLTTIYGHVFQNCTALEKVWLRSTCTTITASAVSQSPFYTTNKNCVLYVAASSKPSGFGSYWDNYDGSTKLSVVYRQTTSPF